MRATWPARGTILLSTTSYYAAMKLDTLKIAELQRAYLLASYQALGARRGAGMLPAGTEARALVNTAVQELEAEAATALAAWKQYVGCTPKVEEDFAARYGAQQRTTTHLQAPA